MSETPSPTTDRGAYQAALTFALFPLIAGVLIFMAWYFTRAQLLIQIGMAWVIVGTLSVLAGAVMLFLHGRRARAAGVPVRRDLAIGISLLLLNFVAAAGCIGGFMALMESFDLTVRNEASERLTEIQLVVGNGSMLLGELAPGESMHRWIWLKGEGTLRFRAVSGEMRVGDLLDEYYTPGLGVPTEVTVTREQTVTVSRRRQHSAP